MTEWRAIDSAALRDLLDRLYSLSWRWSADEVPGVVEKLGWTVKSTGEYGVTADIPDGFGGDEAMLLYASDGGVERIDVRVSDRAPRRTPERLETLLDGFADVVKTITEVRGAPTATEPGPKPSATWRDDRYTLTVLGGGAAVLLGFAPTTRQDAWDRR